jgi:hypothetical protein
VGRKQKGELTGQRIILFSDSHLFSRVNRSILCIGQNVFKEYCLVSSSCFFFFFFSHKKWIEGLAGFTCVFVFFPSYAQMTFITCLVVLFEGGHLWKRAP